MKYTLDTILLQVYGVLTFGIIGTSQKFAEPHTFHLIMKPLRQSGHNSLSVKISRFLNVWLQLG